jgi:hypothetical protein
VGGSAANWYRSIDIGGQKATGQAAAAMRTHYSPSRTWSISESDRCLYPERLETRTAESRTQQRHAVPGDPPKVEADDQQHGKESRPIRRDARARKLTADNTCLFYAGVLTCMG